MGSHRGLPEILSSYPIIHYQAFQGLLYSIPWKSLRAILPYIIGWTRASYLSRAFEGTTRTLSRYNLLQRTKLESSSINLRIKTHEDDHFWRKLPSKNDYFSFSFIKNHYFSVDKMLLTLCVTLLKSMWTRCAFICSVLKSTIPTVFPKRYPLRVWTIIS